jgi:hypothetical protein
MTQIIQLPIVSNKPEKTRKEVAMATLIYIEVEALRNTTKI